VPQGSSLRRNQGAQTQEKLRGVLAEYDRQIGRLLDGLKAAGLDERTLVIFTSDNGPMPAFDGARTGGLRGSKISLYEGGIREPFIARWPGKIPAGKTDELSVLCSVDLFPTFCALAKARLPKAFSGDGVNVSQALFGKPMTGKRPLFWEYGRNDAFNYPGGRDRSPNVAVREGNWKLLINADGSNAELYDLSQDEKETTNEATQNQRVAKRLSGKALAWRKSLP
jgi:arylsulfatase A-like enzyme